MLRVLMLLAVLTLAGATASATEPAPVDPGVRGEWLAFVWLDLRPLADGDHDASREAAADLLKGATLAGLGAFGAPSADDRNVIEEAAHAAAAGRPVAVWIVPAAPGERSAVNARVWGDDGSARDIGTVLPPDDHRLQAAAGVLGPEGFAEWPAHRRAVEGVRPGGPTVLELALNIDAIRHQCPGEFDTGGARGQSLLSTLGVSNARLVGFHVRLVPAASVAPRDPSLPRIGNAADAAYAGPPLAIVEASWSARSQPPGTVHHAALTLPYWPVAQMVPVGAGDAAFVVAGRAVWRPLAEKGTGVYEATFPTADRTALEGSVKRWHADHGSALDRLLGGLGPWVGWSCPIGGEDRGRLVWRIRLRPDAPADSAARLLAEIGAGPGDIRAASRWGGLTVRLGIDGGAPAALRGSIEFGPAPR